MKADIFISKYFDGELTRQEDKKFRELLANDPLAKDAFDSAMAVHIAMHDTKEHDSLTEDELNSIGLSILSNIRQVSVRSKALSRLSFINNLSSVAAILLFVTMPITDSIINKNSNFDFLAMNVSCEMQIQSDKTNTFSENSVPLFKKQHTKYIQKSGNDNAAFKNAEKANDFFGSQSLNQSLDLHQSNDIAASVVNSSLFEREEVAVKSFENAPNNHTLQSSLNYKDQFEAVYERHDRKEYADPSMLLFAGSTSTEVQLATFLSNGILKVGDNVSAAATSVSQSIGYLVSKSGRIGLEVGYTDYSVADGGTISVPIVTGRNGKGGVQDAGDINFEKSPQQLQNGSHYNKYETQSISFIKNKIVCWGSAFYEQTLFENHSLSVNARIGAGGSSEGPMAFSRAYALYAITPKFFITVGADSRIQYLQAPMNEALRQETSTGVSVIYGLQIKL